ncbi:hypothetical protein BS47DRAFT_1397977 [Hydnum rufescens UP504]|uniref:Uncharacterized protein n=1 Tax=Hydnum rufescens UP504 TaxID=1448309 RepID=A0A9P6ALW9_9AGAM|nr:hypothetical protein BS47DRAFT_1397977 [Hydnum rufescens UP504]
MKEERGIERGKEGTVFRRYDRKVDEQAIIPAVKILRPHTACSLDLPSCVLHRVNPPERLCVTSAVHRFDFHPPVVAGVFVPSSSDHVKSSSFYSIHLGVLFSLGPRLAIVLDVMPVQCFPKARALPSPRVNAGALDLQIGAAVDPIALFGSECARARTSWLELAFGSLFALFVLPSSPCPPNTDIDCMETRDESEAFPPPYTHSHLHWRLLIVYFSVTWVRMPPGSSLGSICTGFIEALNPLQYTKPGHDRLPPGLILEVPDEKMASIVFQRSSTGTIPFHVFMCSVQPVAPKSMDGMCKIPFDVVFLPVICAISYSILEKPIKSRDLCSVPRSTRESYKASPLDMFSFGISMQMYVVGDFLRSLYDVAKKRSKDISANYECYFQVNGSR